MDTTEGSSTGLEELEVLWIIDYGTKTAPVGAQIRHRNQEPSPGKTSILCLQGQSRKEVPQIVGYVLRNESLEFVWGYELSRLRQSAKKGTCIVVAAFERLKLAILGTGKESVDARERIEDELKNLDVPEKSAEDLFVRHLVALKPAIASAVSKEFASSGNHRTAQQISELPVHVFFAAPEMVDLGRLHNLSKLLMLAGFPETTLVPEAEAAGAWHAWRYCQENLDPKLSGDLFALGAGLIVCDVGGWTCNISSFTISSSLDNGVTGARIGMRSTGTPVSHPLGSEMINAKLLEFIKKDLAKPPYKNLTHALSELGLNENALDYSLSKSFESFKVYFQEEETRAIEIKGTEDGQDFLRNNQTQSCVFELTAEQVIQWIDELANSMIVEIERMRTPNSKLLTMTGGFSFNEHLIEVLKSHFEPSGLMVIAAGKDPYGSSDLAVVNGAAARYLAKAPQRPFPYALGIPEDEIYIPALHTDMATDRIGTIPDPDDPENEAREWVEGRYAEILPRGKLVVNSSGSHVHWLKRDVREMDFEYEKEIFFTKEDIPEHAPTRPNGRLRPELKIYDIIKASFSRKDVMGMPLKEVEDKPKAKTVLAPSPSKKGVAMPISPTKAKASRREPLMRSAKQSLSPEHELYLKLTTTLNGMDVSVKVERPRDGCDVYVEVYQDNGELVLGSDDHTAPSSQAKSKQRKKVLVFRDPPQEDMIHVTSTSLLDAKYFPQLQREEGTTNEDDAHGMSRRRDSMLGSSGADAAEDAEERRDTLLGLFEDEDDVPRTKRSRRH